MKNSKKIIFAIISVILIIAIVVLAAKLIKGTFNLLGGAVNAVLGIVIILALVIIVIWMFSYAAKKRK